MFRMLKMSGWYQIRSACPALEKTGIVKGWISISKPNTKQIKAEKLFLLQIRWLSILQGGSALHQFRLQGYWQGDSINVMVMAIIEDGLGERLINLDLGEIILNQCNPLVPVDDDEIAIRNNDCIDARGWVGCQWNKIERTDYCRKLYKSPGWPIFK